MGNSIITIGEGEIEPQISLLKTLGLCLVGGEIGKIEKKREKISFGVVWKGEKSGRIFGRD